jgi:hypothetical protein
MDKAQSVGRRGAIGLIGVGTALASVGGSSRALAASRKPIDFGDPQQRLKGYMLMRGALDDRLVIGCVSGQYFGVVDGEMTPLFGVVSATFTRFKPRAGGGYDGVSLEVAYFTDPVTGKAMAEYRNPVTGETVAVPPGGLPAAKISILPDLSLKLGREVPGLKLDHSVLPAQVRGDDIWIPELTRTAVTIPGVPQPFRYSEMTTLHARRSELEAVGAKQVTCDTSFTNVVSWRHWLKMGDRPGHMMAIGAGRYGATIETLPPAWIEATRAQRPEIIANPSALLDPLWKTL